MDGPPTLSTEREWRELTNLPFDARVYVRFALDKSGQVSAREVVIQADERVASDHLQRIPLSVAERQVRARQEDIDVRRIAETLPPLQRQAGDTPETFAQRVAEHYRTYAAISPNPAKQIADRLEGVPVSRVHRWVREARKLGALPPGRPGRAG